MLVAYSVPRLGRCSVSPVAIVIERDSEANGGRRKSDVDEEQFRRDRQSSVTNIEFEHPVGTTGRTLEQFDTLQ